MKKTIPIFVLSHLICLLLGYWLGTNQITKNDLLETTHPTEAVVLETEEYITPTETTELVVSTGEPTISTETPEETTAATEATESENIPVYLPSVTTPPATQPPVTNPPATEPSATQPPATQPPASNEGLGGGADVGSGGEVDWG